MSDTPQIPHTKTPWHIGGTANPNTDPRVNLWSATPAGMQSGDIIARDLRPADAALVLHCVNHFQEVVEAAQKAGEALRHILSGSKRCGDPWEECPLQDAHKSWHIAQEALALIEKLATPAEELK